MYTCQYVSQCLGLCPSSSPTFPVPAHLFSLPSSVVHYRILYQHRSFVPLSIRPSCYVHVLPRVFAFELLSPGPGPVPTCPSACYLTTCPPVCLAVPSCKLFSTNKQSHPASCFVCVWLQSCISRAVTICDK